MYPWNLQLHVCYTGDNALDYVIEGAKVSAVDFNSCQIALVELKVGDFRSQNASVVHHANAL